MDKAVFGVGWFFLTAEAAQQQNILLNVGYLYFCSIISKKVRCSSQKGPWA
jgi:hypothetical protein